MKFVASVDLVDNEVGYILSLFFRFFVRPKVLQPTDCFSLTSHCLAWIWDILFFFSKCKTTYHKMVIDIHGDCEWAFLWCLVQSTEQSVISEFHSFSSWSCTWTYFLQQALKGQKHNHRVKLLQELHPISVYYSLCSWGTPVLILAHWFVHFHFTLILSCMSETDV